MASNFARPGTHKSVPVDEAKTRVLEAIRNGAKVNEACHLVGRSPETYRDWMKTDAKFKAAVQDVRSVKKVEDETGTMPVPDFPEFCRDWLQQPLFPHQMRMLDVIEGKPPRDLHPSMDYLPGYNRRVLINVPPEHCPTIDTLVPTARGMVRAADIVVGDQCFDRYGKPTLVLGSETHETTEAQFVVTFSSGDKIQVDGSHLWFVRDLRRGAKCYEGPVLAETRTDFLLADGLLTPSGQRRWRVDVADATYAPEANLPLDPYVFGYWLGDGDTNGSRLATSDEDCPHLTAQLDDAGLSYRVDAQRGGKSVYIHGIRKLLPLGNKHIPAEYFTASIDQRLALLQGLMDADGTITAKDSRARYVQRADRDALNRQVYALIASLGLVPHYKTYMSTSRTPAGTEYRVAMTEIGFRTQGDPVFRLPRKAARQRPVGRGTKTNTRTIVSIEPAEPRAVQAIITDSGELLLGQGHILSHNAKSTTFTINYTLWLIHKNPDVRVVIMSQGKTLAQRMLYEIKLKLTSPLYRDMHTRFAPVGDDGVRGWRDPDNSWTTDAIYVKGKGSTVDGVGKDPTVQALGLGGQIYGTRADVIFLDDVITTKNAREIDKQVVLLDREIESRLPSDQEGGGLLAILGTRVAPQDLYRHLLDVTDHDDERVWTYFRQPAVLDYGDGDSSTWLTLWPEKWNGKSLARRKRSNAWNLVYQQLNVDDEMTFKAEAVEASINRGRFPGPISGTNTGHQRADGMAGLYIVAGIDPATVGCTAIIVAGLDRATGKRYVIDGWNKLGATSSQIIEQIKYLTDIYPIQEWVVERNAFQRFLAQLPEVVNHLRARGARVHEHNTTANKMDEDWGIQTMSPLFDSCGIPDERAVSGRWKRTPKTALMELPCERQNTWVNELVQQLTTWQPSGNAQKARFDLVMALWFTHIAFDKMMRRGVKRQTHLSSPFMSPAARGRQQVINLAEMRRQKQEAIA